MHFANQYSAYSEIQWDLENVLASLTKATSMNIDQEIRAALFTDALMAYGRVFAEAEGRSGIKLDGSTKWLGTKNDAKKRHQELIDFRNKLFAHTGQSGCAVQLYLPDI